jgi:hypothetical protein
MFAKMLLTLVLALCHLLFAHSKERYPWTSEQLLLGDIALLFLN